MQTEAVTWSILDTANVADHHYQRRPVYLVEAIADQNAAWEMHIRACDHLEGLPINSSSSEYEAAFQAVAYAENTCKIAAERLKVAQQRYNLEPISS